MSEGPRPTRLTPTLHAQMFLLLGSNHAFALYDALHCKQDCADMASPLASRG